MTPAAGSLAGRKVIVTGGSYGMGAATVAALVAAGAKVAALSRSWAADPATPNHGAAHFHCDVAVRLEVNAAFAAATEWLGGLDVLIHAAGIVEIAPAETASDASWDRQFDVNARGTFHTNQAAFPHLCDHGGAILNFASHSGVVGTPMNAVYAASKGAVIAWTRSVAHAWAKHRITVNAIAPAIRTPMYEFYLASLSPNERASHDQQMGEQIPLGGRLGDAETDFVPLMVFLAGSGARFITGQTFAVDGGLMMVR